MVLRQDGGPQLVQAGMGRPHQALLTRTLIERMHRYCVTKSIGKVIEGARKLVEMWLLLENGFDRQTAFVDGLLSQLLKTE